MSVDWRDIPSLASLRAFDATARHGGFAGAARSLNVTHAAIASISPKREYADVLGEGFDLAIRALFPSRIERSVGPGLDCEIISDVTLIGIAAPTLLGDTPRDPADLPWLWHELCPQPGHWGLRSRCTGHE
jgi:DNA-binding transcriptional LysR family regulator